MNDVENIKVVDRIINRFTFWLAVVVALILLVTGVHYTYDQLLYEETADVRVQEEIDPVVSQVNGHIKEIRFEENIKVKKGDTLTIVSVGKTNIAILAPSNGKIGRRYIHNGQSILVNQAIASLVNDDQGKWLVADFKETQISHIHPGKSVEIIIDAFPDKIYHGTILSLAPATRSDLSDIPAAYTEGTFIRTIQQIPVRIEFTDPKTATEQLTSGMSATVKTAK